MSHAYRSDGVVSKESAGSFLEHLPSCTPVYDYDPQCAMESLFPKDSVEDRFVVLKHFPPDVLAEHTEKLPGRCDYSPSLRTLILTMPSEPHEVAASAFEFILLNTAQEMKVRRRIKPCAATRIDTPDRSKEADRSWKPRFKESWRQFPTVVLEVGFSETAAKLEKNISWWINQSEGEVRMGITIDIKRGSGHVEIKSWTPAFQPQLRGVYVTAKGRHVSNSIKYPPLPRLVQRILVKKGRNGSRPFVEGGPLSIPFRALLLDEPGEGEGDFALTDDMLLNDLAEVVWGSVADTELAEAKKRKKRRTA